MFWTYILSSSSWDCAALCILGLIQVLVEWAMMHCVLTVAGDTIFSFSFLMSRILLLCLPGYFRLFSLITVLNTISMKVLCGALFEL
ncbi:hypothetical protein RSAG8_00303, partial [Rhizoctonia solani AG-8 WAC10335]